MQAAYGVSISYRYAHDIRSAPPNFSGSLFQRFCRESKFLLGLIAVSGLGFGFFPQCRGSLFLTIAFKLSASCQNILAARFSDRAGIASGIYKV